MQQVPKTMRASVLTAARTIEIQERATPQPAPDQVLIRVTSVGVCGSDVHFYEDGKLGDWLVTEPLVLGHEAAGEIVAVGKAVDRSRIGERVSIEPQRPNPTSVEALRGQYNLDPDVGFYAVPGVDGAFQEYVTIQSHFACTVPKAVSDDTAALLEPLSVAIASARKAHFSLGQRVLIAGAGPIGLITAQVARAHGVREVIVSDVNSQRRESAMRFGATGTLDARSESPVGLGVDSFVDASGVESAVRDGIDSVRPGGRAVLVGMGGNDMSLPVSTIMNKEILLTGVFRYNNTWPTAINLVADGAVNLDELVTGHFALDRVEEALASTTLPATLKSVVKPQN